MSTPQLTAVNELSEVIEEVELLSDESPSKLFWKVTLELRSPGPGQCPADEQRSEVEDVQWVLLVDPTIIQCGLNTSPSDPLAGKQWGSGFASSCHVSEPICSECHHPPRANKLNRVNRPTALSAFLPTYLTSEEERSYINRMPFSPLTAAGSLQVFLPIATGGWRAGTIRTIG